MALQSFHANLSLWSVDAFVCLLCFWHFLRTVGEFFEMSWDVVAESVGLSLVRWSVRTY